MLSTSTSCGSAERIYRRHPTYQLAQLGPVRPDAIDIQDVSKKMYTPANDKDSIPKKISNQFFRSECFLLCACHSSTLNALIKKFKLTFSLCLGISNDDNELKYEDSVRENSNCYLRGSLLHALTV